MMTSGTATGAAGILNVTQPAVSQLIRETEEIVGYTLFDRRGGRLAPTQDAQLLYEEIRRCYTGIDHINAFCDKLRSSKGSSLVIASIASISLSLLPRALARLRVETPEAYVKVLVRHSQDAIEMVGSQKCDIGFGTMKVSIPGIECTPISTWPMLAVLPPGHRLSHRASVSLTDLADEPYLRMSPSEGLADEVESWLRAEGVALNPIGESATATVGCAMVEAGIGITLVDHAAAYLFLDREVCFRPVAPNIPSTYFAYRLSDGTRSRLVESLLKQVLDEARSYEARLDQMMQARRRLIANGAA